MGPLEILLIVVLVVLLFGGKKIPELFKGIGQGVQEFKKTQDQPEKKEEETPKAEK